MAGFRASRQKIVEQINSLNMALAAMDKFQIDQDLYAAANRLSVTRTRIKALAQAGGVDIDDWDGQVT